MFYFSTFIVLISNIVNADHWKNPIPYKIHNNITYKDDIMKVIDYYHQVTNVKFVERTNQKDYIEFANIDGCWSFIGKQGGQQYISIADGCDIGAIIHEIAHAIGVEHEQSRSDRDNYVSIKYENIEDQNQYNFRKRSNRPDLIYDFNSIMHYGQWDFTKNGKKTIELKRETNACFIGQRYRLSRYDILLINDLIDQPGEPKNIEKSNSVYLCGGRNFLTYIWIYSEYHNINGEYYQSQWPFQGAYKFIKLNPISQKWEITHKDIVYATSNTTDLRTTKWIFLNKNTGNIEIDESSYLGELNEDNYISSDNFGRYILLIMIIILLLLIFIVWLCSKYIF